MKNNNQCEFVTQSIQLVVFTNFYSSVVVNKSTIFVSKFAINQNASINKDSKSSNSKNLKEYTFAKSMSLCCFCFCFVRKIDRFHILICEYLRDQDSQQDFQQDSHSRDLRIYLLFSHFFFCFRLYVFTSIAFVMKIQLQSWSITHSRFHQWISSQCQSIEEMNNRFETKLEKKKKILLRACLKIFRLKIYFINENSYEN